MCSCFSLAAARFCFYRYPIFPGAGILLHADPSVCLLFSGDTRTSPGSFAPFFSLQPVFSLTFFCFYPVAAYLLFREKQRVLPFVGLLVCTGFFLCAKQAVPVKIFLGFLLFALAWMLQKHTEKYESLLREFRSTGTTARSGTFFWPKRTRRLRKSKIPRSTRQPCGSETALPGKSMTMWDMCFPARSSW